MDPKGLQDGELRELRHYTTYRYTLHDWYDRVQRLVTKFCGEGGWEQLKDRADQVDAEWEADKADRQLQADEEREERQLLREAQAREKAEKENEAIDLQVRAMVGAIRTDVTTTVAPKTLYHQKGGQRIHDPTRAYMTGTGFTRALRERGGIKLQITVSLDISNSNWHNGVAAHGIKAFRELYLALKVLAADYPEDIFTAAFTWAGGEDGKDARWLKPGGYSRGWSSVPEDLSLDEMEDWRYDIEPYYSGEDTWMYPLLKKIQWWEERHSHPGAVKLDIVITDGVLEHPTDVRKCNQIQEVRDGVLTTVMLNFLPRSHWYDASVPRRCVQYPADAGNVNGLMRKLLHEFVGAVV
jgi:hypothetical protein